MTMGSLPLLIPVVAHEAEAINVDAMLASERLPGCYVWTDKLTVKETTRSTESPACPASFRPTTKSFNGLGLLVLGQPFSTRE